MPISGAFPAIADLLGILGLTGLLAFLAAYLCLGFRLISGDGPAYFALNTLAAGLLLGSLAADFTFAAAALPGFWITVGLCAIALRLRRRA